MLVLGARYCLISLVCIGLLAAEWAHHCSFLLLIWELGCWEVFFCDFGCWEVRLLEVEGIIWRVFGSGHLGDFREPDGSAFEHNLQNKLGGTKHHVGEAI
jgi:hypothetical protein